MILAIMWLQKKLPLPSHFSTSLSISVIVIPSVLISLIVFALSPPHYSLTYFSSSWKSIAFSSSNSSIGLGQQKLFPSVWIEDSLSHSHESSHKREQGRLEKIEAVLAKARFSIREAAQNKLNLTSDQEHDGPDDYIPQGSVYWNADAFLRSYQEMEKLFKIYVYEEGELPIFHNGPCRSIYSTEGNLIYEMEKGSFYRTSDPTEAHVFFLPFSVVVTVQYLYEPGSKDRDAILGIVSDYINTISIRHPFWNSSLGADHFMLSCHDWGPFSTKPVPNLFHNSIRVLCNANTSEGFNPLKDVSLPEINLKTGENMGQLLGGALPSQRPFLAFFAGRLHGHIRHLLLGHWKEKDPDIQVYDELPRNVSYGNMLRSSKFCLCPSGYEVASPRVVEAIYAECIPVFISNGYVPPLSDVLNWEEFSLVIDVENIINIKKILMGVSEEKYLILHERLKQVQRHFVMNGPPIRFDLFHMIVHSIWLRRLNIRIRNL